MADSRTPGSLWTAHEDVALLRHVASYGTKHWSYLQSSGELPHRDQKACCNRFILLKRKFFQARAKGERLSAECVTHTNDFKVGPGPRQLEAATMLQKRCGSTLSPARASKKPYLARQGSSSLKDLAYESSSVASIKEDLSHIAPVVELVSPEKLAHQSSICSALSTSLPAVRREVFLATETKLEQEVLLPALPSCGIVLPAPADQKKLTFNSGMVDLSESQNIKLEPFLTIPVASPQSYSGSHVSATDCNSGDTEPSDYLNIPAFECTTSTAPLQQDCRRSSEENSGEPRLELQGLTNISGNGGVGHGADVPVLLSPGCGMVEPFEGFQKVHQFSFDEAWQPGTVQDDLWNPLALWR